MTVASSTDSTVALVAVEYSAAVVAVGAVEAAASVEFAAVDQLNRVDYQNQSLLVAYRHVSDVLPVALPRYVLATSEVMADFLLAKVSPYSSLVATGSCLIALSAVVIDCCKVATMYLPYPVPDADAVLIIGREN